MMTIGTAAAMIAILAMAFEMTRTAAAFGAVAYYLIAHCP